MGLWYLRSTGERQTDLNHRTERVHSRMEGVWLTVVFVTLDRVEGSVGCKDSREECGLQWQLDGVWVLKGEWKGMWIVKAAGRSVARL